MVTTQLFTAEYLEQLGAEGEKRFEIVDGQLIEVEGVGGRHGRMNIDLASALHGVVRPRRLGLLFSADTRFILRRDPDLVLMPDIAFIRADRLPQEGVWERTVPIPPDAAIEIASPNDPAIQVRRKAALYLEHGVRLVWIVWPRQRTVSVLQPDQPEITLGEGDVLDGGDVIPGFRLPVATIFAD